MKKYYSVSGALNKGFVGQISYTICLDKEYTGMDIEFSFDKQRYTTITEELKREIVAECKGEYGADNATDDEITSAVSGLKTEIHTIITMNDEFIGGVHRQLTCRHMLYTPRETSEGCIPQESIQGVIKITLVVFNVIQDDTHYQLTLSVSE